MNDFSLIHMAVELLQINEDFPFRLEIPTNTRISDFMKCGRQGNSLCLATQKVEDIWNLSCKKFEI